MHWNFENERALSKGEVVLVYRESGFSLLWWLKGGDWWCCMEMYLNFLGPSVSFPFISVIDLIRGAAIVVVPFVFLLSLKTLLGPSSLSWGGHIDLNESLWLSEFSEVKILAFAFPQFWPRHHVERKKEPFLVSIRPLLLNQHPSSSQKLFKHSLVSDTVS